ncbi:tetratricopeptide repeat protein [Agaribacterium sp. ZY112]|uniref:tetratricopeptide repeat protein n=1 Tax=Agaribacterium sp. ZY112 TaxID=3233574 RepID=UPI0035233B08
MIFFLRKICWLIGCSLLLVLSSCSVLDSSEPKSYKNTIADLPALDEQEIANETEALQPLEPASLDEIEQSYRAALEVANDDELRHQIISRLADIEMAKSEDEHINAVEEKTFFDDAVLMYEELLVLNQQRAGQTGVDQPENTALNERILYQLSKAYALDGRLEESNQTLDRLVSGYPASPLAAEAEFRQAEKAFSDSDYETAEVLYGRVANAGKDTPFYTNSVYMQGWSRFKRNRYRAAIAPFTEVLDHLLGQSDDWQALSNSQKNLAQDTLRILSISFSYLDGTETIAEVYGEQALGSRSYEYLIYANLGELYYEKERYRDSADCFLAYAKRFPASSHSPAYAVKAISVYELGGFPSLVLPAKESFVEAYGVRGRYWPESEQQDQLKPYLKLYLTELSSYYHSKAQTLDQVLVDYNKNKAAGKKQGKEPESSKPNYIKAADLYAQFTQTFPEDPARAEMSYLQGEAYYSADELAFAVTSYKRVAYDYVDEKYGPDAAYNAVLISDELVQQSQLAIKDKQADTEALSAQYAQWQENYISNAISFADYYPADERSVAVLTKAAQVLYEQQQRQRAIEIASRLTQWQPQQKLELQKTAWLVLANSQFELGQYAEAELAYRALLARLSENDEQRANVQERIAASMYKQSEEQLAAGEFNPAIDRLLLIPSVAPHSEIARIAQYDAANKLIEIQDWARAEQELDRFKSNYPDHKLAKNLEPKQLHIYEQTQQWAKAAGVLAIMALSSDPEQKRTSVYLAAEMYEKSGNDRKAIEYYRRYAHDYADPFDLATEARFKLTELYAKLDEQDKRDYWLKKLISEDKKAGSKRTDRSQYLAAMASAEFADDAFKQFELVKLTLPIKKSMKSKKKAMDSCLKKYKAVRAYGLAAFTSQANHRIAELYAILAEDLIDSERPSGLDELASEQYEILLEEQVYPLEEKAIDIYSANTTLSHNGVYDEWIQASFDSLATILPARYGKKERYIGVSDEL